MDNDIKFKLNSFFFVPRIVSVGQIKTRPSIPYLNLLYLKEKEKKKQLKNGNVK